MVIKASIGHGQASYHHTYNKFQASYFLGSPDIDASYRNFSLPREYSSNDMFLKEENFDPCQMYALKDSQNLGSCDAESFNTSKTIECQSFVYDTSLFPETGLFWRQEHP